MLHLINLCEGEDHPAYKQLEEQNNHRQFGFLESAIIAAVNTGKPWLSHELVKATNYHAIVGLHPYAGEYRPCRVEVGEVEDDDGKTEPRYIPPPDHLVPSLMDDFINEMNWRWEKAPSLTLAANALWRINSIHPFVNGNGRTARAVCYFVLCTKASGLLPGSKTVPEILGENKDRYIGGLVAADNGNMSPLIELLTAAVTAQVRS